MMSTWITFRHRLLPLLLTIAGAASVSAHPMGNFSINHYARITPAARSVEVLYVLDIAELPTLQMMQTWGLTKESPQAQINAKARVQAQEWIRNLTFTEAGASVEPRIERTEAVVQDGAGGLAVIRINSYLRLPLQPGTFQYEDGNYPGRAGWKEVVVDPTGVDRSAALTAYPQDPTLAPPQETSARFELMAPAPILTRTLPPVALPVAAPPLPTAPVAVAKPHSVPSSAPSKNATASTPAETGALGSVRRNDFLSRTLKNSKDSLPIGLALVSLAVAFGFGALHAVEPGHGKTMVAAYLIGSRGTFQQAIFLGGMVTFTHTISVFALGLITLFLTQYILPETVIKTMGIISGVSIVWIGGLLLYRRGRKLIHRPHSHAHAHDHAHSHANDHTHHHAHTHPHTHDHHSHDHHSHDHAHPHTHDHHHPHTHGSATLTHTHDGHTHSHVPEGNVTLGSLIALGVSGGLVPCPAALVLLLSCISIGRPGFGLLLLLAFSLGLALVLMLIGVMVLAVKNSMPKSSKPAHSQAWALYAPVASATLIVCIGIYMTGVSVGAFPVVRLIG